MDELMKSENGHKIGSISHRESEGQFTTKIENSFPQQKNR